MKKNLRIVSAAAAALLAVAPVAATAVVSAPTSTVSAATDTSVINAGNHGAFVKPLYLTKGDALTKEAVQAFVREQVGNSVISIDSYTPSADGTSATFKLKGVSGQNVPAAISKAGYMAKFNNNGYVTYSTADNVAEFTVHTSSISATAQVLYVIPKEAALFSGKAVKGATFTKTNKTLSKDTPVKVAASTIEGSTGDLYYEITAGSNKGLFINAADVTTNAHENGKAYFATANGHELANNATVYANTENSKIKTLGGLKAAIMRTVDFGYNDENGAFHAYGEEGWNKYVFNNYENDDNYLDHGNATSDSDLISQLLNQGVKVTNTGNNASIDAGSTTYTITVRSNNGKRVNVVFQNTDAINKYAPAFSVRSDKNRTAGANDVVNAEDQYTGWGNFVTENNVVPTITLVQRDSGTFNPRNYIKAVDNIGQQGLINFDIKSNNVDWTKPGLYSVQVSAKNAAGKTTDLNIPVVVSAANGKMMTAIQDGNVYKEENGKMVQANLVNFNVLHTGSAVRVYDTKTVDGVQYYRLVSPTTNLWVRADVLKDGVVATPAQETTKTITIMHISTIYDKNGKATNDPALRAYDTYSVVSEPVTINGAKFYKLAGKDQYIKVGNVDGTSRSLKHNAYVYKSSGKRANKKVLKKGSTVTTYGKSFMIRGSQMYRIGKNQYVKKANF